ncbi:enoyl-CoA hydratase-related protein [Photobacterium galatheae]|uniref:Gamma-carboxygeranoyl-CoA hydratase n=1 Tax=Photobacterium galatheae TaxID=1654360 RepID=A0A066RMR2_9GAMM|nr:enoyl-CoA hydratase-related protein [Photobacterium galatheae]KDM91700.1 gamma-carboxygeranoyl-CoA hydratase [Photobacterium galatheae]MCM0149811.1 enoyl-CoA hydratase/isomerase family protein [Photobacterium galatheae]
MTSQITPVFQPGNIAEILHATARDTVLCTINRQGVATLTINRSEKYNAFDDQLIAALRHYLKQLARHPDIRVLLLRAAGKHFSSGADLNWMKSMAGKSRHDNLNDAQALALLMHELDTFPHPTLVSVQGSAFGGALGLICCCDIAIGTENTRFCFSEVKLGLIPATIGPYVCRTLGQRQARRLLLTAETVNAKRAQALGILHDVCPEAQLEERLQLEITTLLANSPQAMSQVKLLCRHCETSPINDELIQLTSEMIADIRVSAQGQEGLSAFFDKRPPNWVQHYQSMQGEQDE